MNELIKIESAEIGGETIQTCNARDLHTKLGVGKDFSTWIKDRIEKYGFEEGGDFVRFSPNSGKTPSGGRPTVEYYISLPMAKELSMVENSEIGREVRRYFIDCERIAKQVTVRPVVCYETGRIEAAFLVAEKLANVFKVSQERAAVHALAAIEKDIGMEAEPFRGLIPSIPVENAALLNPTEIGKRLKPVTNAAAVNRNLALLGFIERVGKEWKLTEKGAEYGENRPYERNSHSGFQILWKESVLPILQETF